MGGRAFKFKFGCFVINAMEEDQL